MLLTISQLAAPSVLLKRAPLLPHEYSVDRVVGSIVRPLAPATAVGRPLLISLQLAPQIEPLLMTTIVASRANQCRARFVGVPIKPHHHGDRPLHSESENQLHLRPHAANAAVGEIPIK